MNTLLAILWKDLVIEWRTRERVVAMAVFAVLVALIFHFAAPAGELPETRAHLPGLLWVATLFAAVLGLNRSFALELENDAWSALALAPADRGFLFLGKALANTLLVASIVALETGVFALAFQLPFGDVLWSFSLIAALGTFGICCLGSLFSAMAVRTAYREVLLPLLLLPLLVPVLIGAVRSTQALLSGEAIPPQALRLLLVSDGLYLIVSFLGFEFVLDE